MVRATIICESEYEGEVSYLCNEHGGIQEGMDYAGISLDKIIYKYRFPLSRIVSDFYSQLKSITRGRGSFDYEDAGWEPIKLVVVTIMINQKPIGPLSVLCDKERSHEVGKKLCERLSKAIMRQLYEVNIQAVVGGKIIAKRRLAPFRKDVLIKAGKTIGKGDLSRKKKVLDAQKEGKKRMKAIGKVNVPQSAFMAVLKN